MKKYVPVVIALVLLFSVMILPIQASAVSSSITSIKSGETVFGSPAYKTPEDYSIAVCEEGTMTIDLETDGSIILEVTDSNGKQIAPSEYHSKTKYGSHIGKNISGYYLSYANSNSTKVAIGDFIYNVKKGDYFIRLSEQYGGISAITMKVTTPPLSSATATPIASMVRVDGQIVKFDAYTIDQNNYVKLRDLAKVLSGTQKQFEVTWDGEKNAINLLSGKAYTPVSGELIQGDGASKNAQANTSAIYHNGNPVALTAYTINGNNFFKLRDIGKTFDFDVSWDGVKNTIIIDTSKSYGDGLEQDIADVEVDKTSEWYRTYSKIINAIKETDSWSQVYFRERMPGDIELRDDNQGGVSEGFDLAGVKLVYCLKDIDHDNVAELLIGARSVEVTSLWAVYSFKNHVADAVYIKSSFNDMGVTQNINASNLDWTLLSE